MNFLKVLLINGLIVLFLSWLLPGVGVEGYFTAVWVGLLLGVVNFFVKPLLTILTIPITILTLGLFLIVINGLMVLLVDAMSVGFSVNGLGWAILFSLLLGVVNAFLDK
ncbi:MAG: phage holin family protein [Saprospiraceae bacterium]|nr:phage holin family protein [Saprospiraceae bacterium]